MTKIFTSKQIKAIDDYTIRHEPVSPYDLMERASRELTSVIARLVSRNDNIMVFAGTGNNGGDGLAVSRMMAEAGYRVRSYVIDFSSTPTEEWKTNFNRLSSSGPGTPEVIRESESLPFIPSGSIVIDAIFGSGITRSPEGIASEAIKAINDSESKVISLDMPSGLPGEDSSVIDPETIIRADYTLAIEFPRLSFMFPENHRYIGHWILVPIGLHPEAIAGTDTPYYFPGAGTVASMLRRRDKFDHKGKFGHALLAAGSYGKMGAVILAARAALRAGAGLLTCHIPSKGYNIIQGAVPEAMAETDQSELLVSEIVNPERFDAIGIGPGMGTKPNAQGAVNKLLSKFRGPLVLDADAINILGLNPGWMEMLTPQTILTPHPGEFARIAGISENSYKRLKLQIDMSHTYKCVVVLKGAHTSVSLPDGRVFFNSTGNPGMATAGSGDVLTGIILGLLAQGYPPEQAAVAGVYLHGLAGDIAAFEKCQESLIASDIIENLHKAYNKTGEQLL